MTSSPSVISADFVAAAGVDRRPERKHREQAGEGLIAIAQLGVDRIGQLASGADRAAVVEALRGDADDAIGLGNGQLAEQDLIEQREDRGVGADAERDGEDGDGADERRLAQHAPA